MTAPFTLRFRVRYGECDAQGIVFNARWGDYVDLAATEYTRHLFGAVRAEDVGFDWRLRRQEVDWRAPARFDDALEARVRTLAVGTTSFRLATEFARAGQVLVAAETVYVVVDPAANQKRPVPQAARAALLGGAAGVVVDWSGPG